MQFEACEDLTHPVLCGWQGVLNGVDDKPEGFDGNTDALLAAKAQAKQQLQSAYQLSVRLSAVCIVGHVSCCKAPTSIGRP